MNAALVCPSVAVLMTKETEIKSILTKFWSFLQAGFMQASVDEVDQSLSNICVFYFEREWKFGS